MNNPENVTTGHNGHTKFNVKQVTKEFVENLPRPPTKEQRRENQAVNPIQLVRSLTLTQHVGFNTFGHMGSNHYCRTVVILCGM